MIGSGSAIRTSDIPAGFPHRDEIYPDEEWINAGDSTIVAPGGAIVAGPLHETKGILYAECDPSAAAAMRRTLDTAGHYSRPDVFEFRVNRRALRPAAFSDEPSGGRPLP